MSPTPNRQLARRDSASSSKPYTKAPAANPADDSTQGTMHALLPQSPGEISIPGFPTYAQYKHIESTYLTTLSQKKREKALITQAMFDKIWDTLQDPDGRLDSAQFRFWVRKMFRLSGPNDAAFPRPGAPGEESEVLLLHDNRPVAIQEQLYELLCYCHGLANHGGRDRTRQAVCQHYSWVPKELVARFVKICPTCTARKCGNPDLLAGMDESLLMRAARSTSAPESVDGAGLNYNYFFRQEDPPAQQNWPPSRGPLDYPDDASSPSCHEFGLLSMPHTFVFETGKSTKESALRDSVNLPHPPLASHSFSSSSASSQGIPQGLQSHPMSREVSLYKGLPNGWQYHSGYSEAYEAHMKDKGRGANAAETGQRQRDRRPRIPSIAPLRDANFALLRSNSAIEHGAGRTLILPPMARAFSEGIAENDSLPSPLRELQESHPQLDFEKQGSYVPYIDPALVGLEIGPYTHIDSEHQFQAANIEPDFQPSDDGAAPHTAPDFPAQVHVTFPTPTKFEPSRRPVPPTLDFSSLSSANLVNFKDRHFAFAGPFPGHGAATPSTGSASSCYSQLSPFPMVSPSSFGEPSPTTSEALPSPSEVGTRTTKELANTANGLQLGGPNHQ